MATLAERNSNWSHPNSRAGSMQSNQQRQQSTGSQPPSPSVDVGYHHQSYGSQRNQSPAMSFNPQPQVQMHSPQWSASPPAQFYPQYPPFFNPGAPHMHPHPYYDPAQQQQHFAQWAYQQMLLQQQQQQVQKAATDFQPPRHRGSPSPVVPQDFYQGQAFPSPPNANQPQGAAPLPQNGQHYQAFHPYRRPPQSRQSSARSQHDGFPPQAPSLPYVTTNESSTSLDSTGSGRSGSASHQQQTSHPARPRTNSSTTNKSSSDRSVPGSDTAPSSVSGATRHNTANRMPSPSGAARKPSPPVVALSSPQIPASLPANRKPSKPSPLSQESNSVTADERSARRISRDDSELSYAMGTLGGVSTHVTRTGGLKGRLRRALTMNTIGTNRNPNGDAYPKVSDTSCESSSPPRTPSSSSPALPSAEPPGKVRSKSLFNLRFNASTDNISLSSTVSSASVMIRKIGSMGRIARRSSIAGITRLFRADEKKKNPETAISDDEEDNYPTSKSRRAEASVSHATVEFDRGTFGSDDLKGLSPAARLARQHTLKSKAADAAKAEQLASQREKEETLSGDTNVPATWDRGTAKRAGPMSRPPLVTESGTAVIVEDDTGSDSDKDEFREEDVTLTRREQFQVHHPPPPVDDLSDDEGATFDEDVTVRLGSVDIGSSGHRDSHEDWEDDASQWGVWRTRQKDTGPVKGILRNATNFIQEAFLESASNHGHNQMPAVRVRANSYSVAEHTDGSTPGPLAHIPSPDPDHIDGLHDHHHHQQHLRSQSQPDNCRLPDFSFEFGAGSLLDGFSSDSPDSPSSSAMAASAAQEKSIFNLPNLNSSAPVLLTAASRHPAPLIQKPAKKINFAANLSIYDTFSASIYDRRCEPATCNRLTPALAQRIKEELNTYKMEEMEVHVASRVHTHFFV